MRFINSGFYNAAFIGAEQPGYSEELTNSSNTNHVPSKTYTDLLGQYNLALRSRGTLTFFFGVDNVFNIDPPLIPGSHGTGDNLIFSPLGTTFKAGARFKY